VNYIDTFNLSGEEGSSVRIMAEVSEEGLMIGVVYKNDVPRIRLDIGDQKFYDLIAERGLSKDEILYRLEAAGVSCLE
jgi:hypothetical protein